MCRQRRTIDIIVLFISASNNSDQIKFHLRSLCSMMNKHTHSCRSYSYNYGVAVLSDSPISIDIEKRISLNQNRLKRLVDFSCNDNIRGLRTRLSK